MTLVGQVFSNRYEIEREIAQGGMAEVYLARDQSLDRPVALKALFPEFAREPSFVERFRREAQAAANLNHPNIVAIYDWGQEHGHVLHRHGVRRGPVAARPHPRRGPARPEPGRRHRAPRSRRRSRSRTATVSCTAT